MESNSLGVPLLEISADQAVASSSAVDMAGSITSDVVSSLLLLGGKGTDNAKKRASTSTKQSGPEKIESIYSSVDKIRTLLSLIVDTSQYLETTFQDPRIKLALEALEFSVQELRKQSAAISSSVNNTKEKKSAKQAHAKLSKEAMRQEANRKMMAKRLMKENPRAALQASMKLVKETLSLAVSNSASNSNQAKSAAGNELALTIQPRKKSKTSEDSTNKFNIRLPRPLNGQPVYTPRSSSHHYYTASQDLEHLTGTTNKLVLE